jgi:hypothetical protein
VLVQGRFDNGQLRARFLVDGSGKVTELGGPPPHGPDAPPPHGPRPAPDAAQAPAPAPALAAAPAPAPAR